MDYTQTIAACISAEEVCGVNLEDDAGFQNFFFTAQGTPERYDGEKTIPAESPDWREVKADALSYLKQTKDIKLISVLAQAVLNTEGVEAFSECVKGLSILINEQWQALYPPLDEDDGDPLERISSLAFLNDDFVVNALKSTPLASVRGLGIVNLDAIEKATNGSGDASLSISQIKGIFKEINSEQVQLLYTCLAYSLESLQSINQHFIEKAGYEYTVDFERTTGVLQLLIATLKKYTNVGTAAPEQDVAKDDSHQPTTETNIQDKAESQQHQRIQGTNDSLSEAGGGVNSRADVEKYLKLINEYYLQYEPSSPVPVLINRALQLVNKDFMEIIKNMYPDAEQAIRQLGGIEQIDEEEPDTRSTDDSW